MLRITVLSLSLALLAGCTTDGQKSVPRAAADAMTGSPWTLTAVSSLTIEGAGKGTDQSGLPFAITSFQRVMNFKKGAWQQQESRDGGPLRSKSLAGAERLHHPFGFVMAAFAPGAKLSNTRREGNAEAVDLAADGAIHTLFIDAATKLPIKIVSRSGNETVETSFDKYVAVHGYHLPSHITRKLGDSVAWELNITRQIASADAVPLVASAPGDQSAEIR